MAAARTPAGLDTRGRRLWRNLTSANRLGPAQLVLAEEACRLADRLDQLHALLSGDASAWASLQLGSDDDTTEVTVIISSVLSEARLHATALKGIVTELRQTTPSVAATDPDMDPVEKLQDEVAKKRRQRQQLGSA
jgi:hypothetical protein